MLARLYPPPPHTDTPRIMVQKMGHNPVLNLGEYQIADLPVGPGRHQLMRGWSSVCDTGLSVSATDEYLCSHIQTGCRPDIW